MNNKRKYIFAAVLLSVIAVLVGSRGPEEEYCVLIATALPAHYLLYKLIGVKT